MVFSRILLTPLYEARPFVFTDRLIFTFQPGVGFFIFLYNKTVPTPFSLSPHFFPTPSVILSFSDFVSVLDSLQSGINFCSKFSELPRISFSFLFVERIPFYTKLSLPLLPISSKS